MGLLWFGKKEPEHKPPDSGAQGNFRWGTANDIARIGGFEEVGLPVGYIGDRQFYHPAERKPHGTVFGGTGSGKTTKIFSTIGLCDAASKMSIVSVETAGDWSGICLPYRSKLG